MKTAELQYDFTGLHNFVRLMDSADKYVVKVGIFGNKNARGAVARSPSGKGHRVKGTTVTLTNAELGLVHELGSITRGIPARSFLRMPIALKSKEILKAAFIGAPELLRKGNIKAILGNLGKACEVWIQTAFATGGFGNWAPDKTATKNRKGGDSPLIDTGQLRRSVTSKVDEK